MENSDKKSDSVKIPKKKRSLDLKSLYDSRVSKVGESKTKVSDGNELGNGKEKKRKIRKEVSLSSFESCAKRRREEDVDDEKSDLGFSRKSSGGSKQFSEISLALGNNGSAFSIPKRPRGSVGWKKIGNDQVNDPPGHPDCVDSADRAGASKTIKDRKKIGNDQVKDPPGHPDCVASADCVGASKTIKSEDEGGLNDNLVPLATVSAGNDEVSISKSVAVDSGSGSKSKQKLDSKSTVNANGSNTKLKPKARVAEVKGTRNGRSVSLGHAVKKHNLLTNNGDRPSKKCMSNSTKKKHSVVGSDRGESSAKKSEPSVGSSVSDSLFTGLLNDDEDDEENLEQNAARMLSSRFDPSCTGFSSKKNSSVSESANGFSFPLSSARGSVSRQGSSWGGGESTSADDRSRALRPRREGKNKGLSRKRRHFYEILPSDLDPYWVLKRRVKVFWPLDKTWYYGLLDDYHQETKLHHIKYDDRDQEWVDLQEEKFKLLLLPTEVPGKMKSRRQSTGDKDVHMGKSVTTTENASCMGNYLDSEPIASWLPSSSQRVKALRKSLSRLRTSESQLPSVASMPSEKTDNSICLVSNTERSLNKFDHESASNYDPVLCGKVDQSLLGSTSSTQLVYVRKKYHKKREECSSMSREVKACGNAPSTVTLTSPVTVGMPTTKQDKGSYGYVDSNEQLQSTDNRGILRLDDLLMEFKEMRFHISLPIPEFLELSCVKVDFRLLHDIWMLQCGVITIVSPAVILEMLSIDSNHGLQFLLFEGCMKEALVFVFLIMIVFSQSDEHWNGAMEIPVTSIRLRLSSAHDLRKRHRFAFYSFSGLQSSEWLFLDSKFLEHCRLNKHLSVPECTYDNIKELECGLKKQHVRGILPIGVPAEAFNATIMQSGVRLPSKLAEDSPFVRSISAASSFLVPLHLQLLMEDSFASVSLQHQNALCSTESSEKVGQPVGGCAQFERSSTSAQDLSTEHGTGLLDAEISGCGGLPNSQDLADIVSVSNVVEKIDSCDKFRERNTNDIGTAGCFKEFTEISPKVIVPRKHESKNLLDKQNVVAVPPSPLTSIKSPISYPKSDSTSRGMILEVPSVNQIGIPFSGEGRVSRQNIESSWNSHDGFDHNTTSNGPRTSFPQGRSRSIYSPVGHNSTVCPDGKPTPVPNGFSNGPKKPRTQVQYTLPFAGYDFSGNQEFQNQRSLPCKRIRRASLKRVADGSKNNEKKLEFLDCVANVLVTRGDRGWRECGAHVLLEVGDHNEWSLAVKLSGVTKYSYKVKHVLQPGSANRYSHAMMWKGGKDWVLEFPDRSQWALFKEMHEECYNRNIRAASVKNIPIPGVRLIEENDEYGAEVPFARNPLKYYRQVQTDEQMALYPSRVMYDMDSDDERWLMSNRSTDKYKHEEISEEFLEQMMDMFEKVSYVQMRDSFTDAEIEELVSRTVSAEAAKLIYGHWRQKRERKGMPLVRHLQPPLWEIYQRQLKEWERTVARGNSVFSAGSQEKVLPSEKPPMFAFCLRPRGLEVPNKGTKQRSHRKFPVSGGTQHLSSGNHDGLILGRRSNGNIFGDEKMLYTSSIQYSCDVSPSLLASTRVLSPQDAHFSLGPDVSDWNRKPKFYKNKPKILGPPYPSWHNSYNKRTLDNRHVVQRCNMGLPELPGQQHYLAGGPHRQKLEQLDGSDLHEYRLRNAPNAAKHARNLAKLKRERAQRMHHRADLAIHKAVVALMTAEAIKDSFEKSNGGK